MDTEAVSTPGWAQWQNAVVAVIRTQFNGLFASVGLDDIDWPSWRWLFDEGRSPAAAVSDAFMIDL
ncbi:MAG: hypothetical protein QM718_05815 [Steroidobacteraceae bacterium]